MHNCMRVFAPTSRPASLPLIADFAVLAWAYLLVTPVGQDHRLPNAVEATSSDISQNLIPLRTCTSPSSTPSKQIMIVDEWAEEAGGGLEEAIKGDQWT